MLFTTCPITGAHHVPSSTGAQSIPSSPSSSSSSPPPPSCPFASITPSSPNPPLPNDPTTSIPLAHRHATLSPHQKALIRSTVPLLESHGLAITSRFYASMLSAVPALRDIFNTANQHHLAQPRALADAVLAYARNIDNLAPLAPVVERVAAKHASLFVRPDQYAIVGEHLIGAIGEVLGEAVTPEIAEAWTRAYWMLAEVFIVKEDALYRRAQGWTDWKDFRIVRKVVESDVVTSFHLEPVDASMKPLPRFLPGQYISLQIDVPQLGHRQARQYSLSDHPDPNYYRISIKAERGSSSNANDAPGLVSVLMHDTKHEGDIVRLSHPEGDFFLNTTTTKPMTDEAPLVLISGGIGLTPLTSMLNSLVRENSTRPIAWVHGARHSSVRPFVDHVRAVAQANPNVQFAWFNDQPQAGEVQGQHYHYRGFIDLNKVDKDKSLFLNDSRTRYYVCGPPPFMLHLERELLQRGVTSDRIHMEKFGVGN